MWQGANDSSIPGGGAERETVDYLFSVTYEELRRLAATVRRGDRRATINTTALVHEAWLKLAGSPGFEATSPGHFKRIAARAMRQLLVEAARRRTSQKRGSGALAVELTDAAETATTSGEDVLALDHALNELAKLSPRQAMLIESRFFGGLDVAETAMLLNVSESSVLRDWRAAKAWLASELVRSN